MKQHDLSQRDELRTAARSLSEALLALETPQEVRRFLEDLCTPAEIEALLTHYVVWFTAVGEYPVRQGTLEYDPETRIGRASFPTSMLEFDVQITAEQSESPTEPSDLVVASQKIREK